MNERMIMMKPFSKLLIASALTLAAAFTHANETAEKAERLISIDGALTETVYAVGAESKLVAVD